MSERWDELTDDRLEQEPWWARYVTDESSARAELRADLTCRPGYSVDPTSFIAHGAHVVASTFTIGARSTIAAGCSIRGEITIGSDSALNAGAITIGTVTIGNAVRIASYAVLVGENHVFDDAEMLIMDQGLSSVGIAIEDDVWIGANVTVVDGVTIGAHSVVAAGAVVTADVAPYGVVAGVPARRIRDRRSAHPHAEPQAIVGPRVSREVLTRFDATVAEQWPEVLTRCRAADPTTEVATFVDVPGQLPGSPRPLNDAIEIAGMFGAIPPACSREELVTRIRAMQDPITGTFIDPSVGPVVDPLVGSRREWDLYGILSCGYALEVLGTGPEHPVHVVEDCSAVRLIQLLDRLDQTYLAWPSGSWIDAFGTALYFNRRHHASTNVAPALWGWLMAHQHRGSGVWGTYLEPTGSYDFRWLMAVNGFYRLTRGTYAQFGEPVPNAEAAIDTVLAHARDSDRFASDERNACNLLDVVHPLWLLGRQTDYRGAEIRDAVAEVVLGLCADWVDGQGFPWHIGRDHPGLQGTEMFLAVLHIGADILGECAGLSFIPRGVHRLAPATTLD